MDRYVQRGKDFTNALERLKEAISEEPTEVVIDGVLHRFEFTFELAWKTIKDYLEYMGVSERIGSPREVIQRGYKQGIIQNGEEWIEMMLARNSLSHLYDEETSRTIYNNIVTRYIKLFENLKDTI